MTTEREKFEAWMKTRYKPGCAMLGKDADGDYTNVYTMMEWAGWKARADMLAADGAQSEPKPVDEMALGFAIMEHLGPAALTGGRISPIDSFTLGWNAAMLAKGGAK